MTAGSDATWSTLADLLDPPVNPYLNDPVGWAKDVLGIDLWSLQAAVAVSVAENKRTTVQAGHGVGKTFLAAVLLLWFISVHPVGQALVITTAPTDEQVRTVLWREVLMLHEKAGLPGRITLDAKWHMGSTLVAFGRKPADHRSSALQGHHAKYLLVIADEASGIPFTIWDQLSSLISNAGGRMLAIGNPTDPASHFAKICSPGSGWTRHKISVLDSPNLTGEQVSEDMRENLSDVSYIKQAKKDYGEGTPLYVARVLGEFPDISDDTLIAPKYIEAAMQRSLPRDNRPRLGVDVARYGKDETALYRREDGWVRLHRTHKKLDTMVTAGHVVKAFNDINTEPQIEAYLTAVIDEDGVGGGVLDRVLEQDYDAHGFKNGSSPIDKKNFADLRSETYWNLKDVFENGEIDIDPNDDKLIAQLGSIKWKLTSKGQIKTETKEDMGKRGLPSPDRADAVMMAWSEHGSLVAAVEDNTSGESLTGDLLSANW